MGLKKFLTNLLSPSSPRHRSVPTTPKSSEEDDPLSPSGPFLPVLGLSVGLLV